MEVLPLLELRRFLLIIVFVVVEFISLRSTGTVVTVGRLHQDIKVRDSFKVLNLLHRQTGRRHINQVCQRVCFLFPSGK